MGVGVSEPCSNGSRRSCGKLATSIPPWYCCKVWWGGVGLGGMGRVEGEGSE